MSRTRPPDVTIERLRALLDAYGAAPERWPEDERAAAEALVAQSAAARAFREEAAALDRALDTVPSAPPSPLLAARVLATAPRPRPTRAWRRALLAAVPLAAAAVVTLWIAVDRESERRAPDTTLPEVGEYAGLTDALLEPYAVDVSAAVPSFGCADSDLGCPNVDAADRPFSQRQVIRRSRA